MTQYIIRRVLLMIPTLVGVSLLVTAFVRLLPGDAIDIILSNSEVQGASTEFKAMVDGELASRDIDPTAASFADRIAVENEFIDEQLRDQGVDPATATDAQKQEARNTLSLNAYKDTLRSRIGLDKNYIEQWWDWTGHALRGDLGESLTGRRSVASELNQRIPATVELGLVAMAVSLLIALPIGVLSAVKQDTWADYISRSTAIAMLALPSFFIATLTIALSARWFGYSFPVFYKDFWEDPQTNFEIVIAPAIILGIGLSGTLLRLTRAQMLEVMRQDYMRTAQAKGLAGHAVVIRHGVRNAMIPVVTIIGLQVPVLIGGSLVLEQIFFIPGVSRYLFEAIQARDFPVIIAVNMVVALAIIVVNLAVDLTYAWLDPRVTLA
ncbi:MAG: ABC transporter permease [Dehalococcoidia bacterium]|nr:ABC transporter permease [Dehalococcoidia bacterium]